MNITKQDYNKKLPEIMDRTQFINFLVPTTKLKDRKLIFDLKKSMNTVLELAHYSISKRKTIGISTDRLSWLRVVDRVRTAIEEYEGYISIPKLIETAVG